MFFSSDRIIPQKDIFRDFSSYVENNMTSQMSKETEDKLACFTKEYCKICKRERIELLESVVGRLQVMLKNPNCNLSGYRDFLKNHPNYKISCLESTILIKDALDSSNIKNTVMIVFGDKKDDRSPGSHTFNVYWYRNEMFVCDTMAKDGPYMYNGYLSSVIPFKEYMYMLNAIYDNIKLYVDTGSNFWNLNFSMKADELRGFSEIKVTVSKN